MAIFADVVEEWKKASGKEKLLIVGGGAAVVVLALYLHNKSSSQSTLGGTGTTGLPSGFQAATGGTGSAPGATGSPPPNDGGTPIGPPALIGPPTSAPPPAKTSIVVGKDVANNTTLAGIARDFGISLQTLYDLNPWLGKLGGNYVAGGDYDPYLPGNVAGHTIQIAPPSSSSTPAAPSVGKPSLKQPNTTMAVYAQTRHSPGPLPATTKQSAPPQTRAR